MAVTDFFAGEIATELLKQLFIISSKEWRYKSTAEQLITLIEEIQPTIKEIQYSGVELPPHRQAQIGMLLETLEKGKKLTAKVLKSHRWNMVRQLYLLREMENLEKTISNFLKAPILTEITEDILADVYLLRANSDFRFERIDRSLEMMTENLGSMKIGGGGMIREAMKIAEATMEIETNNDSEKMMFTCSMGIFFLLVINLLTEIASAVSDQLSSLRKPYFARISLVMSILSVVLSILDLNYKIRAHRARFRCRWMRIPWFYYPERNYSRIFGSFTDNTLLFCGVGQLIVSTINFSFIERRLDGPIKVSVWPLFFAISMLCSKFMEKPAIYKKN